MKSDPKECLYCQNNETLHNLMIEIAQLSVSRVFLSRTLPCCLQGSRKRFE